MTAENNHWQLVIQSFHQFDCWCKLNTTNCTSTSTNFDDETWFGEITINKNCNKYPYSTLKIPGFMKSIQKILKQGTQWALKIYQQYQCWHLKTALTTTTAQCHHTPGTLTINSSPWDFLSPRWNFKWENR